MTALSSSVSDGCWWYGHIMFDECLLCDIVSATGIVPPCHTRYDFVIGDAAGGADGQSAGQPTCSSPAQRDPQSGQTGAESPADAAPGVPGSADSALGAEGAEPPQPSAAAAAVAAGPAAAAEAAAASAGAADFDDDLDISAADLELMRELNIQVGKKLG